MKGGKQMKLLLTGDLHISDDHPERLVAFRWMATRARELDVDGLLIAGDLFDSNSDFRSSRSEFSEALERLPSETVLALVPGNHDSKISSDTYLGDRVTVLDENDRTVTVEGRKRQVDVWGMPYLKEENSAKYLESLEKLDGEGPSILLTHGSLVAPGREYILNGVLEQGGDRDFLIYQEDLLRASFNLVVIGHWHKFHLFREGGTTFLYPGSPLPMADNDYSRKFFSILTVTEENEIEKHPILAPGTWYYRREEIFFVPGEENAGIQDLRDLLQDLDDDHRCYLKLDLNGYLGTSDERRIKKAAESAIDEYEEKFYRVESNWGLVGEEALDKPLVDRCVSEIRALADQDILKIYEESFEDEVKLDSLRAGAGLDLDEVRRRTLKRSLQVLAKRLE